MSGGTAAAAPPPFRSGNPALCGSHPLVTSYCCRLGDLQCFVFIVSGYCIFFCIICVTNSISLPYNLYCVGGNALCLMHFLCLMLTDNIVLLYWKLHLMLTVISGVICLQSLFWSFCTPCILSVDHHWKTVHCIVRICLSLMMWLMNWLHQQTTYISRSVDHNQILHYRQFMAPVIAA